MLLQSADGSAGAVAGLDGLILVPRGWLSVSWLTWSSPLAG